MGQTLTIRLPGGMRKELEGISRAEKVPLSDLVRDSLKKYVAVYRFRRLRRKVIPYATTQGILTDDDLLDSTK